MEILIRPYRPADREAVAAIHDKARRNELELAGLPTAFLPFAATAAAEGFFDYPHIDVAVMDGQVAGFSAYTGEELGWLYVDPALKRQGIGRQLVRQALKNEPELYYMELLAGNFPARKLYESEGFVFQKTLHGRMPGNESFAVTVDLLIRPDAAFAFEAASMEDVKEVLNLIRARIHWMDEVGIQQWNRRDYFAAYPPAHYQKAVKEGRLYILRDRLSGHIAAAGVYPKGDRYWDDPDGRAGAGYLHNFVSSRAFPGAGGRLLDKLEELARGEGKTRFRIDCNAQNLKLNAYYQSRGYEPAGEVQDDSYRGIRREKKL